MTEPITLPIGDSTKKGQIILSIEQSVKDLIENIAKKGEGDDLGLKQVFDSYPDAPSSLTGVVMHYVIKGIKEDMGIEFNETPKALKERKSPSGGGGTRFTKDEKNELRAKQKMEYYEAKLENNILTMTEVYALMGEAYEKQKEYEGKGWFLTPEVTKPPYKIDSDKYKKYCQDKEKIAKDRQQRGKMLGNSQKK